MRKLPSFVLAMLAVFMAIPMTALAADVVPAADALTPHFSNAALKWIAIVAPAINALVFFVKTPGGEHLLASYSPRGKRIVISALSIAAVVLVGFGSSTLSMQEIIAMAMLAPVTTIGSYELIPNGIMRKPDAINAVATLAPQACANCGHVAGEPPVPAVPPAPPVAS